MPCLLRLAPPLTVLLFLGPVVIGLLGTILPAFGWMPAAGAESLGLTAWHALLAEPGLWTSVRLTLLAAGLGTALSLTLALVIACAAYAQPWARLLPWTLPPLLAVPHLASALGLAFIIAPSGWLARLLSPWLTGWTWPPDLPLPNDPLGMSLTLGLVLRETPFLLFAALAAVGQLDVEDQLKVARSLGYGTNEAWLKLVVPRLLPLLRLPFLAVLAFGVSTVDMAIVLGPNAPPPLSVRLVQLAGDAELARQLPAAAGAILLLLLTLLLACGFWLVERCLLQQDRWLPRGPSPALDRWLARTGTAAALLVFAAGLLSLAALLLWSVAVRWRFPAALPQEVGLASWAHLAGHIGPPLRYSLLLAGLATGTALALSLACLEHESRTGPRPTHRVLALLYLPLALPQLSFLPGLQTALVRLGLDGTLSAVAWTHLVFVLPYVMLVLRDPYLSLHPAYAGTARVLGRGENAAFWCVKLPLLRRPIAFSMALGATVSLALYLPTLFAGAGRIPTLVTETLALAGGGDRRLAASVGLLLALLPLVVLAAASAMAAPARVTAGPRRGAIRAAAD